MCDALSSLPPPRRGVQLGRRVCCALASVHRLPRPRGYSSVIASIRHDTSRWGVQVASPAPGAMRISPRRQETHTVIPDPATPKVCCGAYVRAYLYVHVGQRIGWGCVLTGRDPLGELCTRTRASGGRLETGDELLHGNAPATSTPSTGCLPAPPAMTAHNGTAPQPTTGAPTWSPFLGDWSAAVRATCWTWVWSHWSHRGASGVCSEGTRYTATCATCARRWGFPPPASPPSRRQLASPTPITTTPNPQSPMRALEAQHLLAQPVQCKLHGRQLVTHKLLVRMCLHKLLLCCGRGQLC